LRRQLAVSEQKFADAQSAASATGTERDGLKTQVADLRRQLAVSEQKFADAQAVTSERDELKKKVADLQGTVRSNGVLLAKAQESESIAKRQSAQLQTEVDGLKRDLASVQSALGGTQGSDFPLKPSAATKPNVHGRSTVSSGFDWGVHTPRGFGEGGSMIPTKTRFHSILSDDDDVFDGVCESTSKLLKTGEHSMGVTKPSSAMPGSVDKNKYFGDMTHPKVMYNFLTIVYYLQSLAKVSKLSLLHDDFDGVRELMNGNICLIAGVYDPCCYRYKDFFRPSINLHDFFVDFVGRMDRIIADIPQEFMSNSQHATKMSLLFESLKKACPFLTGSDAV
jgi:hypothetical protein